MLCNTRRQLSVVRRDTHATSFDFGFRSSKPDENQCCAFDGCARAASHSKFHRRSVSVCSDGTTAIRQNGRGFRNVNAAIASAISVEHDFPANAVVTSPRLTMSPAGFRSILRQLMSAIQTPIGASALHKASLAQ
jgi:hypothetical protein